MSNLERKRRVASRSRMNRFVTVMLLTGIGLVVVLRYTDILSGRDHRSAYAELSDLDTYYAPTERIWMDLEPESVQHMRLDSMLTAPRDVLYTEGSLIVSDHPVRILRFDSTGRYMNRYSEGQGFAPGQLPDYSDVFVDDDAVVVLSPNGRRMMRFSLDGNLSGSIDLDFLAIYGVSWNDSLLISTLIMNRKSPFQVVSLGGIIGSEYGQEIGNFGSALDVTGRLTRRESGGLYYVFRYASVLLEYAADGRLIRRVELPDRQSIEEGRGVKDGQGNTSFRAPNPPVQYTDVEYSNGRVYIAGSSRRTSGGIAFIDIYEVEPWVYIGSVRMKHTPRGLSASSSSVYAAADTSIIRVELPH